MSTVEQPDGVEATGRVEAPPGTREHAVGADPSRPDRTRWMAGGFGAGIVLAYVITAAKVAIFGWRILPYEIVWNLIWCPFLGFNLGVGLGYMRHPRPRDGFRWWRRPRFRMRTMMILVAYVALLFGMGVSTAPIGAAARRFDQAHQLSVDLLEVFRQQARQSEAEAGQRLSAAAQLRSGRIPESLDPSQKDFLRSLDRTATPELRRERYGRIADTEEQVGKGREHGVEVLRRLIAYHEALAAKYDRARRRPWLPVEPDPPRPSTR